MSQLSQCCYLAWLCACQDSCSAHTEATKACRVSACLPGFNAALSIWGLARQPSSLRALAELSFGLTCMTTAASCWLSAVNAAHDEQHSALKNLPLPLVQLHTDAQGLVQYHILARQFDASLLLCIEPLSYHKKVKKRKNYAIRHDSREAHG